MLVASGMLDLDLLYQSALLSFVSLFFRYAPKTGGMGNPSLASLMVGSKRDAQGNFP